MRLPLVREGDDLRETSWDDAFDAVERGLSAVIETHGKDAVAMYAGNPTVHSLSASVMLPMLIRALGSKNFYSAATVDQMPKHVSCGYMFGRPDLIPVPDVDRTDYLLVLGANPWVSNGSLATAPDFRGRLEAISRRGGKVVVVDPRRTETAAGGRYVQLLRCRRAIGNLDVHVYGQPEELEDALAVLLGCGRGRNRRGTSSSARSSSANLTTSRRRSDPRIAPSRKGLHLKIQSN